MSQHPFPVDPVYTGIALAYKNSAYIADFVLPRVPVGKSTFKYRKFDKSQYLTVPTTTVGRKGMPNQVELSFSESESSVVSYGLDDIVPLDDIADAPDGYDPLGKSVEYLTELIALDRERRAAALVFDDSTYVSGQKTTLTGEAQFSHANSDPLSTIKTGLDACFLRPNIIVMGREVFSVLSNHSKVVQAIYPNSNGNGLLTAQQLATLFDVDQVIVGSAWANSTKRGGTPSIVRVWGKHIALLHVNSAAGVSDMPTFGLTAEFGTRVSGVIPKPELGLGGADLVRVGERVRELVVCPDLGYFIKNAVA